MGSLENRHTGPVSKTSSMNAERADYEANARRLIGHHITAVDTGAFIISVPTSARGTAETGITRSRVSNSTPRAGRAVCCGPTPSFPMGLKCSSSRSLTTCCWASRAPRAGQRITTHTGQARLGSPIRDVTVWWTELNLGPATRSNGGVVEPARVVRVPVALRFDFEVGPVWFVAGIPAWPDMREVFIPGDEIMIVFTGRRMVELGFPAGRFTEA